MLPYDHVSPSQLAMYQRCPASYYYRYILGIITPPSAALTRGRAVHRGQEFNFRQKIESRKDLPLKEVQEFTAAAFEEEAPETDFQKEKPGQVKDSTIELATLYHNEMAPTIQPKAVEQRVEVAFDNTDYTLLGYIDLIDENNRIRDTKTAKQTPSKTATRDNLQLAAYSIMHRTITGENETGVSLDYLVSLKTPKIVTLEATITAADRARFLNTMASITRAIKLEVFFPNHNSFLCTPEHCGYWDQCHKDWGK